MRQAGVVVTVMWLFVASACSAQSVPTLKAAGTAVVQVQPDQVCVNVSVRTESKEVATARQQAAEKMAGILKAVRALDVPDIIISTEAFQVRPVLKPLGKDVQQYSPDPGAELAREVVGYSVTNSVGVELNGPPEKVVPAVSRVIDAAVKHGATNVGNPQFIKVDTGPAYREALEKATKDAVENLQAIARGLGVKITGYQYGGMFPEPGIEEYYGGREVAYLSAGGPPGGGPGGPPAMPTPVEARAIAIAATVYVSASTAP
ncbi:SIMPL domain-containing protein [bacterium]|nr:SIMPL domain-containing protein [bacterium]